MTAGVLGRFVQKVAFGRTPDDCWEWRAYRMPAGYGVFAVRHGDVRFAHRVSWELINGPIPAGMVVCHRCDNPPCVNPDHLFLGTIAENNADMRAKKRHKIGERHGSAKLTEAEVQTIRRLLTSGASQRSIAARFGVGQMSISDIARGVTWRHIPQPFIDGNLSLDDIS